MAWEEIVDFTVPSNTTSVTLNNFGTITKDDFIKININQVSTTTPNVSLRPNNLSSGATQRIRASGTSVSAVRFTNNVPRVLDVIDNTFAFIYLKISENNRVSLFSNDNRGTTSNVTTSLNYSTLTNDFSNGINSFNWVSEGGNIAAGSRIQIYRLTAEKVADITVSSNTTQVDITGLDIKKGDEYLLVSDISSNFDNNGIFYINDNNTLTNYWGQVISANGSSTSAGRFNGSYFSDLDVGNHLIYSHIKLSNIGAFTHQNYQIRNSESSSIRVNNWFGSSVAENISAINKLTIEHITTNAFNSGTRFQLYKLYEGGN